MALVDAVVIRFAGDSGDGMQLLGDQFTRSSALVGNDIATLPDFPAEIRAPAGTQEGVSGFQLQFAGHDVFTAGDDVNVLVAMNPAALAKNIGALERGGLIVVNSDNFRAADLAKARLASNPLEDGSLEGYRVVTAAISTSTQRAVAPHGLNAKQADRCNRWCASCASTSPRRNRRLKTPTPPPAPSCWPTSMSAWPNAWGNGCCAMCCAT